MKRRFDDTSIFKRSLPDDNCLYTEIIIAINSATITNINDKKVLSNLIKKTASLTVAPVILAATTEKNIKNNSIDGLRSSDLISIKVMTML